jgi:hypothetical protein
MMMATDPRHNQRTPGSGFGNDRLERRPLQFAIFTLTLLTLIVAVFCSAAVIFEGVTLFPAIAVIAWTIIGAGYWKTRVTKTVTLAHVCAPLLAAIVVAVACAGRHFLWEYPDWMWEVTVGIGFAAGTVVSVGIVFADHLREVISAVRRLSSVFTATKMRRRLQFSLRSLFVFTTVVACFFSIAYSVGYEEATGILIALTLIVPAVRWRRRGLVLIVRAMMALLGIGVLWMVAVDRSWVRELCPDCELDRDILQYRVLRIPIHEEIVAEHLTATCRIATDLGIPCQHCFQRVLMTRYWGLFFPAHPCFCGTVRLTSTEWYDDGMAEIVRARGQESPGLAEEFRRRVLVEHDDKYAYTFFVDLKRRKASSSQPQTPDKSLGTLPTSTPKSAK